MNYFNYGELVYGLTEKVPVTNNKFITPINFDNAATTPPLKCVIRDINQASKYYSSVHRGNGFKSDFTTTLYENGRKIVLDFLNGDPDKYDVIFLRNTTEAINKLSNSLFRNNSKDIILTTKMEHHSNDLPWRKNFNVEYVKIDKNGCLDLKDLENKLNLFHQNIVLVSVTGASNVTGYVNPIYEISELVHKYNIKLMVDGAQLVPHAPLTLTTPNPLNCIDFLAFSAHKMYAPFGIGVLITPKNFLKDNPPDCRGGGTVNTVTEDYVTWDNLPNKEECGTPNVLGVCALTSSIHCLKSIGMNTIFNYEEELINYAYSKLQQIDGITIHSAPPSTCKRVAIIPFSVKNLHHIQAAELLYKFSGICVRTGCFCAQPYVQKLLNLSKEEILYYNSLPHSKRPGFIRISLAMYNTPYEIDTFIKTLTYITKHLNKL